MTDDKYKHPGYEEGLPKWVHPKSTDSKGAAALRNTYSRYYSGVSKAERRLMVEKIIEVYFFVKVCFGVKGYGGFVFRKKNRVSCLCKKGLEEVLQYRRVVGPPSFCANIEGCPCVLGAWCIACISLKLFITSAMLSAAPFFFFLRIAASLRRR